MTLSVHFATAFWKRLREGIKKYILTVLTAFHFYLLISACLTNATKLFKSWPECGQPPLSQEALLPDGSLTAVSGCSSCSPFSTATASAVTSCTIRADTCSVWQIHIKNMKNTPTWASSWANIHTYFLNQSRQDFFTYVIIDHFLINQKRFQQSNTNNSS